MAKLLLAASVAALTMALLGYAAGGQLGNFGDVGTDQGTFGFAVFLWFAVVGAITVAMAGGVRYPPRKPKPARAAQPPVAQEPILSTDPLDESDGDDPAVVEADDSSATEQAADQPPAPSDCPAHSAEREVPPPGTADRPASSPDDDD